MIEQYPYFRFYVNGVEVFPQGDWYFENKLVEDGFFYRLELGGTLKFLNDDVNGRTCFDTVKALEDDVQATLVVKRRCSGSYTTYWTGYLDLLGEYLNSEGVANLTARVYDDYTTLKENYDKEYNLFSLGLTEQTVTDSGESIDYDNGYFLKDIIEYIINDIAVIDYQSDFFDAATNPITGLANQLNDLVLHRKSDVIDPVVFDSEKGIISLSLILNWCKVLFNCFPSIDSTGKFRIENQKYYFNANSYTTARSVGLDLTVLESGRYILNLDGYSYNTSKIFRKEKYQFAESENLEFVETAIEYDTVKISDITVENIVSSLTTDIKYIQDKPDEVNSDGFTLMSVVDTAGNLTLRYMNQIYKMKAKNMNLVAYSYDTFTTNGTDNITSAVNSDTFGQVVITNELLRSLALTDQFLISGNFELISGAYPSLEIYNTTTGVISNVVVMYDGEINIPLIVDTIADDAEIRIVNPGGASSWKFENIVVIREPRENVKNGHLTWLNLLNTYFTYGRPLLNGYIYGIERTFDSTSKLKEGKTIKCVPIGCDSFDIDELVKTDIGNGLIRSMKINKDGIATFDLIYD